MFRNVRGKRFQTRDSALSYYVNQLENLDRRLYEPLVATTWSRDVQLRPGVSLSDEATSFILSQFAGNGTLQNSTGNFPWISAETTAIPGVSINGKKVLTPLRALAREVSYTSIELERSMKLGNSIDTQKMDALNQLYQMNTDQMVYIGSSDVGATGLLNNPNVTVSQVAATGTGGSTTWASKTADQILADINTELGSVWLSAAYAVCPMKLGLPPAQFALLAANKVSSAGNMSVLNYLKDNTISLSVNGRALDIVPMKWLAGAGISGSDRMIVYTDSVDRVRFPMVPIQRQTAYYQGIRYSAPYVWAFGEVEVVYPETIGYADGI